MVALPDEYPFSSHRGYVGLEEEGISSIDPVLRLFDRKKDIARERFRDFVAAGVGVDHPEDFDLPAEGDILGSQEFVDSTIHRIGEFAKRGSRRKKKKDGVFEAEVLIAAVEFVFGLSRDDFCGPVKTARAVMAKEVLTNLIRERVSKFMFMTVIIKNVESSVGGTVGFESTELILQILPTFRVQC
jgi:hypothetical protein